jgi:cytochrome c55X
LARRRLTNNQYPVAASRATPEQVMVRKPVMLLLLSSLVVTLPASVGPALALDEARQRELTHLVRQDCGSCHGMTLKGGLGGPLLPSALADLDSAGIASIILEGVSGKPMPPWRGQLSEEEATWIAKKLKEGFPQ